MHSETPAPACARPTTRERGRMSPSATGSLVPLSLPPERVVAIDSAEVRPARSASASVPISSPLASPGR